MTASIRDQRVQREEEPPPRSPTPPVELEAFTTTEDEFGRFRIYQRRPKSEPANIPLLDPNGFAATGETFQPQKENIAAGLRMPAALLGGLSDAASFLSVFANATVALLIQWYYSGTQQKSIANTQDLIDNVILNENFKAEDLKGVNIAREMKKMDTFEASLEGQGWKRGDVEISVPCPKNVADRKPAQFKVEGLLY
jgi:hypothetical protein